MCTEHLDILVDENAEAKNYCGTRVVMYTHARTCNCHIYLCIMRALNFNKINVGNKSSHRTAPKNSAFLSSSSFSVNFTDFRILK